MSFEISEAKRRAKASLKDRYWYAMLVSFFFAIVFGMEETIVRVTSTICGELLTGIVVSAPSLASPENVPVATAIATGIVILVSAIFLLAIAAVWNVLFLHPLTVCASRYFVDCHDRTPAFFDTLKTCDTKWVHVGLCMLIRDIVIGLWSLLLIVPGICKAYEYRMVPYFLADDPGLSWKEAAEKSKNLMTGNKWKAFLYDLSFLGWDILSVFTCGLLQIFFVRPYKNLADAEVYRILRESEANTTIAA